MPGARQVALLDRGPHREQLELRGGREDLHFGLEGVLVLEQLRGHLGPDEDRDAAAEIGQRDPLENERLNGPEAGNLRGAELLGHRPVHAGLAVGDVEFGARAGGGGVLRRDLDALVEDARGHERGDAQRDARDDERGAVPALEQVPKGQQAVHRH
ncbi:hypothetical protein [Frigoriglobus tundricola]|uniref:Uncharacterized protein n=1 Tax=Frigoriglobus tundricola TaxID=2774151 RepID=A0A6M5YUM7_9BACT|nr:hypothetical protein [Frigoriglobus tundricola]QJW97106.1 hypothetical protein FTUN_4671 [Frigoriglobus tundricola]